MPLQWLPLNLVSTTWYVCFDRYGQKRGEVSSTGERGALKWKVLSPAGDSTGYRTALEAMQAAEKLIPR
jgi:hypothetical protein